MNRQPVKNFMLKPIPHQHKSHSKPSIFIALRLCKSFTHL